MKKIGLILLTVCLCFSLLACTNSPTETESKGEDKSKIGDESEKISIKVGVPTAPPALPILRMMETNALGDDVDIELEIWDEVETLIAMTQDGKHDMFAFPLTVVSKLYNKGVDVRLMNVSTWGVTYFLTSDPDFKEWGDLKGKTVYVPLQSSPQDIFTQYFLSEAGLTVGEDVEVIYATIPEVATLLASGETKYATQIEPQVTKAMSSNEDLRVAFSFEDEWQRVHSDETKIPTAGLGASQKFIDENPELTAKFQAAYEEALTWVNENPEEIGLLAEKHLGLEAEVVMKSLPNMGLEFKTALDAKKELDMFYELLFDFDPKIIGDKIADKAMYYDAK